MGANSQLVSVQTSVALKSRGVAKSCNEVKKTGDRENERESEQAHMACYVRRLLQHYVIFGPQSVSVSEIIVGRLLWHCITSGPSISEAQVGYYGATQLLALGWCQYLMYK